MRLPKDLAFSVVTLAKDQATPASANARPVAESQITIA
jgi:hypothetical protein